MATSVLPNHLVSSTTKTYLQQCVDDLSEKNISSLQWESTLLRTAAIATHVAFVVFIFGSLAAATAVAPIFIPIVAVNSFFLMKLVDKGHDYFEQWSNQVHARAEQLKEISRHHQELASATPEQMQQILAQKGIQWFAIPGMLLNPANLCTLKPLIARHNFWEGHVRELEEKKQTRLSEAARLSTENYVKHKNEIYDLRCEALEIDQRALEGKLKNAFINAIIHRHTYVGTLGELGTFSQISGQERAVGNAVNAPSIAEFFTFHNGQTPTITVDEVRRMTISDLAMRLIAVM